MNLGISVQFTSIINDVRSIIRSPKLKILERRTTQVPRRRNISLRDITPDSCQSDGFVPLLLEFSSLIAPPNSSSILQPSSRLTIPYRT